MKLRVPHTYVLLVGLIALAAAATWIVPAGSYDRVVENGREIVAPLSYHRVEARPAGLGAFLLAFPRGLREIAEIVFYIFIIGGAFGVLNRTGVVQAGVRALVGRLGRNKALIVPLLTVVFAVGGGTIGIAEETLVFLPALLLLARSLGYDSLTAGGIALVGANAGFAGAFMNPFTVGVAQGIVGLPLFSGMGFRLGLWAVMTAVTVAFMTRYARRVAAAPGTSLMYDLDLTRQPLAEADKPEPFSRKHRLVLALVLASLGVLVVGAIRWHWGILELSGLFFGLSIAAGPLGGARLGRHGQGLRPGRGGHRLRRAHRRPGPGDARRPARRARHRHHNPRDGRGAPGPAVHPERGGHLRRPEPAPLRRAIRERAGRRLDAGPSPPRSATSSA